MDDRIFPGVPKTNNRILSESKKYLSIKDDEVKTRKAHVASWRRLVAILIQRYNEDMPFTKVGAIIHRDHSMITHVNQNFRHLYEGDNMFYNYIYMNVIAAVENREFFTIEELIETSASFFSITEKQRRDGVMMIKKEKKCNILNPVIKAFVVFLQRSFVSRREIIIFLNLPKGLIISGENIHNKEEYIEVIESVIKSKIKILKLNQIKDEKRKINS